MKRRILLALAVAFVVSTFAIGSPLPAKAAPFAVVTWSITCSSITVSYTTDDWGDWDHIHIDYRINAGTPSYNMLDNNTTPNTTTVHTLNFTPVPVGTPIDVVIEDDSTYVFYYGTVLCSNTPTSGSSKSESPFYNPGDNRVDPRPGDKIAVWCNPNDVPPSLVIYGRNNENTSFLLAKFIFADLVKAGPKGLSKNLGADGVISAMVDDGNNFWVAWNGGKYKATGKGDFAKGFKCDFRR
jgi:hypothetical protein